MPEDRFNNLRPLSFFSVHHVLRLLNCSYVGEKDPTEQLTPTMEVL